VKQLLISAGLLALLLLAGVAVWLPRPSTDLPGGQPVMGVGSVRDANEWRRRFLDLSDPEAASQAFPEVVSKRFPDGTWAFGVCTDSHASPEGGTIVLKDSTGAIRAFFGHVRGPQYLRSLLVAVKSLDELYQEPRTGRISGLRFGEYLFAPEG